MISSIPPFFISISTPSTSTVNMDDPGEGSSRSPPRGPRGPRGPRAAPGTAPPTFVYPLTHAESSTPPPPPPHAHLPSSSPSRRSTMYPGASALFYTGKPLTVPMAPRSVVRGDCNHTTMEREYCMSELDVCDVCHKYSFFGWLYKCTEDTNGFAAAMDPEHDPFLTPHIENAIIKGNYTKKETETLIQQKLDVLNTADATNNPSTPSFASFEEAGPSDTDDDETEEAWTETVEDINQQPSSKGKDKGKNPIRFAEPESSSMKLPKQLPCTHRACHKCRSAFKERIFQNLDDILNMAPPTMEDLLDRPVSDANIVRNLGLRPSVPFSSLCSTPDIEGLEPGLGSLDVDQSMSTTQVSVEEITAETESVEAGEMIIHMETESTTAASTFVADATAEAEADDDDGN